MVVHSCGVASTFRAPPAALFNRRLHLLSEFNDPAEELDVAVCVGHYLNVGCCVQICMRRNGWQLKTSCFQWVGVVAQLVERLVRNEKVAGSIPVGSTSPICASRFPRTSKLDRPCVPTSSMRSLATESAFVLLLWRIRLPPTPFLPKHNPVGATIAPPPSPRPLLHRSGEWACGGDALRHTPIPCSERRKGCGVV